MRASGLLLGMALGLFLTGCAPIAATSSSGAGVVTSPIASMALEGAQSLFVGSQAVSTASAPGTMATKKKRGLKKIKSGNIVEDVVFRDKSGNPIDVDYYPVSITDVRFTNFILIEFSNFTQVLVDKSTHHAYDVPMYQGNFGATFRNYSEPRLSSDSTGAIYFKSRNSAVTEGSRVYKAQINSAGQLQAIPVSPSGDRVDRFCVGDNGELVIRANDYSNAYIARFRDSDATLSTLPGTPGYSGEACWRSQAGTLLWFNPGMSGTNLVELLPAPFRVNNYTSSVFTGCGFRDLVNVGSRVWTAGGCQDIYELENPSHTARKITSAYLSFANINGMAGSNGLLYVWGTTSAGADRFISLDPATNAVVTLSTPGYQVQSVDVDTSGLMSFTGIRLSDGAYVLANRTSGGAITEVSIDADNAVTTLHRY